MSSALREQVRAWNSMFPSRSYIYIYIYIFIYIYVYIYIWTCLSDVELVDAVGHVVSLPRAGSRLVVHIANMAHIRQSRPDSGLAFEVKALKTFAVFPCSTGELASVMSNW